MSHIVVPEARGEILEEEGLVLAVEPAHDDAPAIARVRLLAGDHCEGCPAKSMCRPEAGDRRIMEVADPVGVVVGDRVRVSVPGGAVLKASFLVYGLPLLLLLLGVWLGTVIWAPEVALRDLWSFLLGAALAAAAVPLVRRTVQQTEAAGGPLLAAQITMRLDGVLEIAD
jgi:sigma-E factor negative regulatory protein RseC